MTTQAKKYADIGEYPFFLGRPEPPQNLHGGIRYMAEFKLYSPIRFVKCKYYNDFHVTEFIEVVW